jgi:hypothetical protein
MDRHSLLNRRLWITAKGHKKGRETCPFRALDGFNEIRLTALERMAGTTRLELATSAVTVQRSEVTSCNFTAPIATFGASSNPREFLLHPNRTQIRSRGSLTVHALFPDC